MMQSKDINRFHLSKTKDWKQLFAAWFFLLDSFHYAPHVKVSDKFWYKKKCVFILKRVVMIFESHYHCIIITVCGNEKDI